MKTGLVKLCIVAGVAALLLVPSVAVAKNAYAKGRAATAVEWTFALYVNGDNDLERYWEEYSLPALLNISANPALRIVAVMDRMSTDGTEIIEISGGSWEVVDSLPEKNFGDGSTFSWFITEISLRYPSTKLALIPWDHGYAWRYFSNDQTSGDKIYMPEMQAAIEAAGVYIDILAFDCCNMAAVEVVYQASLTNLVGYIVASEETIPMDGFPYDLMLDSVAEDPTMSPADVAVDMVLGWAEYFDTFNCYTTVGLSAIDVKAVGEGAQTMQAWCDSMYDGLGTYDRNYKDALAASYCAWCTFYHIDMADFGEALLADASIDDAVLRAATAEMIALIDSSVLAVESGRKAEACHGITLYWGVTADWATYSTAYAEVAFANDMGWWAFLVEYNG